jgi:hypothetical protein
MKRTVWFGVAGIVAFVVAGCDDGGPSDADITAALKDYAVQDQVESQQSLKAIKEAQQDVMQEIDPKMIAKAHELQDTADKILTASSLSVASKTKQPNGAYDAAITIVNPQGQQQATVRVAKTNTGWKCSVGTFCVAPEVSLPVPARVDWLQADWPDARWRRRRLCGRRFRREARMSSRRTRLYRPQLRFHRCWPALTA